MNMGFLESSKTGESAARVLLTGSVVLFGLACLASVPALADSATFGGATSATVTVSNVSNVVTTASADPSPSSFTFLQGNAGVTVGNQSNPFSWTNGTLSLSTSSVSGWAASQVGNDVNYAYVAQQSIPTLEFTNTNSYGVEVPISVALTYDQNITCSSCGEYSMNGTSNSAWLYVYTLEPNPYDYLGTLGLNCFLGTPFGPPWNGACSSSSNGLTSSTFPVNGTLTETLDYWVPADSSGTIAVELQSQYQAGVVTPEPRTWILLGTGLLGLVWVSKLRLRHS
jgi:hypothetical protein